MFIMRGLSGYGDGEASAHAAPWRLGRDLFDPICFNYQPMMFGTTPAFCTSRKLTLIGRPTEPQTLDQVNLKLIPTTLLLEIN